MWLGAMSCWRLQDFSQTCRSEHLMDCTSKYLHRSEAQIDCLAVFFLSCCIGKLDFKENLSQFWPQWPNLRILGKKWIFISWHQQKTAVYTHRLWCGIRKIRERLKPSLYADTHLIPWVMHWHEFPMVSLEVEGRSDSCLMRQIPQLPFHQGPCLLHFWALLHYKFITGHVLLPWESKAPLTFFFSC